MNHHRVAIFFKDFAAWIRSSCIGLNVAGYTTAAYLKSKGVDAEAFPVRDNVDIVGVLYGGRERRRPFTRVVISAPWLTMRDTLALIDHFPETQFVILSHSNVGFLQADANGVRLLRQYAELSALRPNLRVGGNNRHFSEWFSQAYDCRTITLPNLYPVKAVRQKVWDRRSPLKVGAFGAIRPEKNFMTAAAAAVLIQERLEVDVELHMTAGGEANDTPTMAAIREMLEDLSGIRLVAHEWETWDRFIQNVARMDLLLQPSYTESFNMVTADGVSVGVPSVVSPAIRWAPKAWVADPDSAEDIARVGTCLLMEDHRYVGSDALKAHNRLAFEHWSHFLS